MSVRKSRESKENTTNKLWLFSIHWVEVEAIAKWPHVYQWMPTATSGKLHANKRKHVGQVKKVNKVNKVDGCFSGSDIWLGYLEYLLQEV